MLSKQKVRQNTPTHSILTDLVTLYNNLILLVTSQTKTKPGL